MAFETLNGIVLRYADYKENDRILTLFTRERGIVSVSARGVRSNKTANAGAVKDIYCYGEFVIYVRNNIEYVSSSSTVETFYPIREDYDKLVVAAQIARIIEKAAASTSNDRLFSLLYHAFSFLAYADMDPRDLLIAFLVKFVVCEGYEPVITRCSICGRSVLDLRSIRFSNFHGGSVCDECAQDEPSYSSAAMEACRRMILLDEKDMVKVRLRDALRNELKTMLLGYIEHSMEQRIRID